MADATFYYTGARSMTFHYDPALYINHQSPAAPFLSVSFIKTSFNLVLLLLVYIHNLKYLR